MDLTSPSSVRRLMEQYKFRCRKRLGQNFLIDSNIISKILAGAELSPQDTVVEIGPGLGTLTKEMARLAATVLAVEIDRDLLPVLEETLGETKNVNVIHGDALKVNFDNLVAENAGHCRAYKIIANLPYYITTPLLMHLLENKFNFSITVVMVQEEVARRMVARPGTKDYGSLSVAIQFYTYPELVCKVSPNVFIPRPEVGSAVVKLTRRKTPAVRVRDENHFFSIVRAAFGKRRKTMLNALSGASLGPAREQWQEIIKAAGLSPSMRGETLGLEEFASLTRCYEERSWSN